MLPPSKSKWNTLVSPSHTTINAYKLVGWGLTAHAYKLITLNRIKQYILTVHSATYKQFTMMHCKKKQFSQNN